VRDGAVVEVIRNANYKLSDQSTLQVDVAEAGWLAARCWGTQRTSYGHALWAHTSPVYLRRTPNRAQQRVDAAFFVERIDAARTWLTTRARFDNDAQRDRMLTLFAEGRTTYERWAR
jgi:hypothetical protein